MRLLIIAALLLSTGASLASPQHPTSAQWRDIHTYGTSWRTCGGFDGDESSFREAYNGRHSYTELKNSCGIADRLGRKLEARGFCLVGKGGVGRASKRHCYTIHGPADH